MQFLFRFLFLFEVQLSSAIETSHLWWAGRSMHNTWTKSCRCILFFSSFSSWHVIVFSAPVALWATYTHGCTKQKCKKREKKKDKITNKGVPQIKWWESRSFDARAERRVRVFHCRRQHLSVEVRKSFVFPPWVLTSQVENLVKP